jgi:hypothetical protein
MLGHQLSINTVVTITNGNFPGYLASGLKTNPRYWQCDTALLTMQQSYLM